MDGASFDSALRPAIGAEYDAARKAGRRQSVHDQLHPVGVGEGGRRSELVKFTNLEGFPNLIEDDARRPKVQRWMDLRPLARVMAQPENV